MSYEVKQFIDVLEGSTNHLVDQWYDACLFEDFNLEVSKTYMRKDLIKLSSSPNSTVLVVVYNNVPVGFIGLVLFTCPLSSQRICNEHYWFVDSNHRGRASFMLFNAAKEWAKMNNCSHLMMNASKLASNLHDRVCRLYEFFNMKQFETTYIMEI